MVIDENAVYKAFMECCGKMSPAPMGRDKRIVRYTTEKRQNTKNRADHPSSSPPLSFCGVMVIVRKK